MSNNANTILAERHAELLEEVKDTLDMYENDVERVKMASEDVKRSEMNYLRAKVALLEFEKNDLQNDG